MAVKRLSISVTPELEAAVRELAKERSEDVSRLVEILLRENPLVSAKVAALRARSGSAPFRPPALKKGRSMAELRRLGEAARERWARDEAAGRVRLLGRGE